MTDWDLKNQYDYQVEQYINTSILNIVQIPRISKCSYSAIALRHGVMRNTVIVINATITAQGCDDLQIDLLELDGESFLINVTIGGVINILSETIEKIVIQTGSKSFLDVTLNKNLDKKIYFEQENSQFSQLLTQKKLHWNPLNIDGETYQIYTESEQIPQNNFGYYVESEFFSVENEKVFSKQRCDQYTFNHQCLNRCPHYAPFIAAEGQSRCTSVCASGIYLNYARIRCADGCPIKSVTFINEKVHSSYSACSPTCPKGVQCMQIKSTNVENSGLKMKQSQNVVCEIAGNQSYCPYLRQGDSHMDCITKCDDTEYLYLNSSFWQCVSQCPTTAKYIQEDGITCSSNCSSGYFYMNLSTNQPQCLSSCPSTNVIQIQQDYDGLKQCELTCSLIIGSLPYNVRNTQKCSATCSYYNVSVSDPICESGSDLTNCPYFNSSQSPISCELSCLAFIEDKVCVDQCSYLFIGSDNQTCLQSCDSGIIQSVQDLNLYQCVDDCQPQVQTSIRVNSDSYYICSNNCSQDQQYLSGFICQSSCSTYSDNPDPTLSAYVCQSTPCSSYYLIDNNGNTKCVDQCPNSSVGFQCTSYACGGQSPFFDGGSCTPSCSSGFYSSDGGKLVCVPDCIGKYWGMDSSVSMIFKRCEVNCSFFNLSLSSDGQCVSSCPTDHSYLNGSSCLAQCGIYQMNTNQQQSTYLCQNQTCSQYYQTYQNGNIECLSRCPDIGNNVSLGQQCVSQCDSSSPFLNGQSCSTTCDTPYYQVIGQQYQCLQNCDQMYWIYDSSVSNTLMRCEQTCSVFSLVYDIQGQCVDTCNSSYSFLNGTHCVSQCQIYQINTNTSISQFTCLGSCLKAFYTLNNSQVCVDSCVDVGMKFMFGSECLSECGSNLLAYETKCVVSCEEEQFQKTIEEQGYCIDGCSFKLDGRCVEKCNPSVFDPKNNCISSLSECNFVHNLSYGIECVEQCSYYFQENSLKNCIEEEDCLVFTIVDSLHNCSNSCTLSYGQLCVDQCPGTLQNVSSVCGCTSGYQQQNTDCVAGGASAKSAALSGAAGGVGVAVIGGAVAAYFFMQKRKAKLRQLALEKQMQQQLDIQKKINEEMKQQMEEIKLIKDQVLDQLPKAESKVAREETIDVFDENCLDTHDIEQVKEKNQDKELDQLMQQIGADELGIKAVNRPNSVNSVGSFLIEVGDVIDEELPTSSIISKQKSRVDVRQGASELASQSLRSRGQQQLQQSSQSQPRTQTSQTNLNSQNIQSRKQQAEIKNENKNQSPNKNQSQNKIRENKVSMIESQSYLKVDEFEVQQQKGAMEEQLMDEVDLQIVDQTDYKIVEEDMEGLDVNGMKDFIEGL